MERDIEASITLQAMQTYGDRVKLARERVGWSQEKLADALGIKQPSVFAIENNPTATSSKHTFKVALHTGVRPEWLETGEPPMESGADIPSATQRFPALTEQFFNAQQWPRDVPILGGASCGEDGLFELNGEIVDHARRPPRLDGVKAAYALWVIGESMYPWRKNGGTVYVHPQHPINIGDYVVVQLKPASPGAPIPAYIKQLVRRTAKDLKLRQYNPAEDVILPMSKVLSVHRVIDWDELLGH